MTHTQWDFDTLFRRRTALEVIFCLRACGIRITSAWILPGLERMAGSCARSGGVVIKSIEAAKGVSHVPKVNLSRLSESELLAGGEGSAYTLLASPQKEERLARADATVQLHSARTL